MRRKQIKERPWKRNQSVPYAFQLSYFVRFEVPSLFVEETTNRPTLNWDVWYLNSNRERTIIGCIVVSRNTLPLVPFLLQDMMTHCTHTSPTIRLGIHETIKLLFPCRKKVRKKNDDQVTARNENGCVRSVMTHFVLRKFMFTAVVNTARVPPVKLPIPPAETWECIERVGHSVAPPDMTTSLLLQHPINETVRTHNFTTRFAVTSIKNR
jgi:hypothetical protein